MTAMVVLATAPRTALVEPTPFTVSIPEDNVVEMKQLIKLAKLGSHTYENSRGDRQYGVTHDWLQNARDEWLNNFEWRAVESEINTFPNYTLPILHSGHTYTTHFIALFSAKPDAIPILLLHGWPGSILEFLPILRLLSTKYTPDTLPYHIIVPSLPGYAFSSPPPLDRDFRLEDASAILDELMILLGFGQSGYIVQGGDVGSKLARVLGATSPRVKAVHLNFCIMPDPGDIPASTYSPLEKKGLERASWFKKLGSAYALEHATKPSTISFAVHSSPLALLAWVGEKFLDWVDDPLHLHTILADVSLYWLTDCFATTLWPYRQLFTPGVVGAHENPEWNLSIPLGFSWFPKEICPVPKAWVERTGNLVWHREHERGGHFAALERPEVLLRDVEEFVGEVWKE